MLFVAMTAACAVFGVGPKSCRANTATATVEDVAVRGTWTERLRWIALAFVPSSLMLGVTTA